MKRLAEFVLQGLPHAVLTASGFAILALILPPVGILSSAVVALIALRIGLMQALYVCVISSAILAVVLVLMRQSAYIGLLSGLVQWLPMVLLGAILGRTSSWRLVMQAVMLTGVAIVVLLYTLVPGIDAFWISTMKHVFESMLSEAGSGIETAALNLEAVAPLITGMLVAAWILSSLLALMLARTLQAQLVNPGGFGREFEELRIGQWAAISGLAFVGIAASTSQPWANALAAVAISVFLVQGFAVAHGIAAKLGWPRGSMIGLYVLLLVFLTPVVMFLAGIGMLDAFADFRRRLGGSAE
jgi:hypothetical protein